MTETLSVDASTQEGEAKGEQGRERVHLLIVDDVPQNLVAMEALLRRDGVDVLKAGSGAQALELLLEHDVALALLDVQMPEMDGFMLAELMRGSQRTRHVPIIFLTASPSDPLRSFKGYDSGAVDFLHKPIDPRVIQSKVNVFIELHQQRQLLRARNEKLEQALKLNETMIAVLTHDLRTPLTVITLCTDKLRTEMDDPGLLSTTLLLDASAHRMSRMVQQLLDFSKIRSDVLRMDLREGDLASIAALVVSEVRQGHPDRQIDCIGKGVLRGVFDPDRLAQVLSNLIGNAVIHGEPGPVTVELDGCQPDWLRMTVSNRGRIPDKLLPRIFEPFKGAEKPGSGLGLGLYIVDQFIRAHGGEVTAGNTATGARFEAVLPRRCAAGEAAV